MPIGAVNSYLSGLRVKDQLESLYGPSPTNRAYTTEGLTSPRGFSEALQDGKTIHWRDGDSVYRAHQAGDQIILEKKNHPEGAPIGSPWEQVARSTRQVDSGNPDDVTFFDEYGNTHYALRFDGNQFQAVPPSGNRQDAADDSAGDNSSVPLNMRQTSINKEYEVPINMRDRQNAKESMLRNGYSPLLMPKTYAITGA